MKLNNGLHQIYREGEGGSGGGGAPVTQPAPSGAWYQTAGVSPEHHEWLAGKQFADASTAIQSYRSLEGIIGRNRLAVPTGPDDQASYNAIFDALGRPKDPTGYAAKEGSRLAADELKQFQPVFHKLGISKAQAEGLMEFYEGRGIALEQVKEQARIGEEERQVQALEAKWGSSMQANTDIASRGMRALGIDEATMDKIEGALGYMATMELLHKVGSGMSEAAFHQDGKPPVGGGSETVETLQNKVNTMLRDPDFRKRYNHDDPRVRTDAIKEIEALQIEIAKRQEAAPPYDPTKRGTGVTERMMKR